MEIWIIELLRDLVGSTFNLSAELAALIVLYINREYYGLIDKVLYYKYWSGVRFNLRLPN